jgi:hypothetical protein
MLCIVLLRACTPAIYYTAIRDIKDVIKSVKTGDLLLFSANGLLEWSIKWYTKTPITHCSIVFVDWKGRFGPKDEVYLLENHPDSLFDHFHHRQSGINGPAMVTLTDKLKNYKGKFLIGSLRGSRSLNNKGSKHKLESRIAQAHYDVMDTEFSFGPYDWLYHRSKLYTCIDYCKDILVNSDIIDESIVLKSPGDLLLLSNYSFGVYFVLK